MVFIFADPFSSPILFMFTYFFFVMPSLGVQAFLTLSLYSSIIAFPFAFIGHRLHGGMEKRFKRKAVQLYVTSLVCTVAFWIFFQVWTIFFAHGNAFRTTTIIDWAISMLFVSLIVTLFAYAATRIRDAIEARYKMPAPLSIFLVSVLMCMVFWSICYLILLGAVYTANFSVI